MRCLAGVLATWTLCVSSALADEPTVQVDPRSPAGQEYAIPLAQGRSVGGGTSADEGLFGAGIKPPSTPSAGSATASKDTTASRRRKSSRSQTRTGSQPSARVAAAAVAPRSNRAAAVSSSADSSGTWILVGLLAAVLAVGALLGAGLGRLRRA